MGDDDVDDDDYDDGGGCGALFRPQATSLRTHCMLLEKTPASRQGVDSAPLSCTDEALTLLLSPGLAAGRQESKTQPTVISTTSQRQHCQSGKTSKR